MGEEKKTAVEHDEEQIRSVPFYKEHMARSRTFLWKEQKIKTMMVLKYNLITLSILEDDVIISRAL
jgi:hypothetical protein